MIIIDAILAFLISSALDTNPVKIVMIAVLFIHLLYTLKNSGWLLSLSKEATLLFITSFIILVNSFYFFVYGDFTVSVNQTEQALGIRKFAIEVIFSFFLYFYLKGKSFDHIMNLIYAGVVANCIIALIELPIVFTTAHRAQMLFFEPSSAGFYYCFSVFLLYLGIGKSKVKKHIAIAFTVIGLIAFSKAQFLVLAVVALCTVKLSHKLLSLFFILLLFGTFNTQVITFYEQLLDNNLQIYGIDRVVSSITEMGVVGLSNDNDVTDTYVTRLSAIYVAVMTIFDYPLGIGASTFNPVYKQYLVDHDLVNVFMGGEVDKMLRGEAWASPRSRILGLVVGAGVIGIFALGYIFRSFFLFRKSNYLIYVAFLSTFVAGVVLELNPILDYLVVLIVLLEKLRNEPQREKINVQ
jgi:hypothetical protein